MPWSTRSDPCKPSSSTCRSVALLAVRAVCLFSLAAATAGCISFRQDFTSGVTVPVRVRVFEVAADRLATYVDERGLPGAAGSSYRWAVLPPELMEPLFLAERPDAGTLLDQTRDQCFWPTDGDVWRYTKADGTLLGGGSGTGGIGVRPARDGCEVRIEYRVEHDINAVTPIDSTLTYEGTVRPRQSVVFVAPFIRKPAERNIHVIAFTFGVPRPS